MSVCPLERTKVGDRKTSKLYIYVTIYFSIDIQAFNRYILDILWGKVYCKDSGIYLGEMNTRACVQEAQQHQHRERHTHIE
jgi:hypothetical protein